MNVPEVPVNWYEVWGCEGGNPPKIMLMKVPAAQWGRQIEADIRLELKDAGVTNIEIRAVER